MKYKYLIALFLAGVIVQIVATLFKITHAPHADLLFKISSIVMATAVLLAIIKILLTKKRDSFLNQ